MHLADDRVAREGFAHQRLEVRLSFFTRSTIPSSRSSFRFATATAAATGWPEYVRPWLNSPLSMIGRATRS